MIEGLHGEPGLPLAQFKQAIRKPWGIMPAYVEGQVSDDEISTLAAYFDTLPANPQPAKWRYEAPAGAPRGEVVATNMGCIQCHGPILAGPRGNITAVDMDFDWFKRLVYTHTTALPEHEARLGEKSNGRIHMGNFNPNRIWEPELRDIYDWARDLGPKPRIGARLSKGEAAANGVTYKLTVDNRGLKDKAPTAGDLTITLILPAGADVVATTGDGYKGTRADDRAKATVAEWQLSSIAPGERQQYSITLSKAGTAADNLRGQVRWTKPAVKTGPFDSNRIAPAPL